MSGSEHRLRLPGSYHLARLAAVTVILAALGFIALSLAMPSTTLRAEMSADHRSVVLHTPQGTLELSPDTPVEIRLDDEQPFTLPAAQLDLPAARSAPDRIALARHLEDGTATARFTAADGTAHTLNIARQPTRLSDLPPGYWIGLGFTVLGALFGLTAWSLRPSEAAAACYAVIGLFLFTSELPFILFMLFGLATPAWVNVVNTLASAILLQGFALSFATLFAIFPRPIFKPAHLRIGLGIAGLIALVTALSYPLHGGQTHFTVLMLEYLALFGFLLWQFWIGRKQALYRRSLMILLVTVLVGIALYALATLLPMMGLLPVSVQQEVSFPIFVLIYGGIGLAVIRTRHLALDGWMRDIMLSVGFLTAVLLLDVLVLALVTQQQGAALGLSFTAAALVYFPLREWLARRRETQRLEHARQALILAGDLAFATQESERDERWRAALQATYRPLEIGIDPQPVERPQIAQQGEALRLPPLAGAPALICRHAEAGRRAFGDGDVQAAEALISMTQRLVAGRDAYHAGVKEERHRIARDLHDDVSGRLMISLHRTDSQQARTDVREAMADIRTIVSGLAGQPRRLGELLADLREESRSRCDAVGFALDWADSPALADPFPLDYAVYRQLQALIRECVSNALRHSGGHTITVAIQREADRMAVEIRDDGHGFAADADGSHQGHGLQNCAVRAEALGGQFSLRPLARGSEARFTIQLIPATASPA